MIVTIFHYHCILAEQMELTNISLAASFFLVAMSFLNIAALWWTLVEISFLRSISFLPSYSAGMDFANRFSALSLDATDREIETAIIKTFSLLHSLLPLFSQHPKRFFWLGSLVRYVKPRDTAVLAKGDYKVHDWFPRYAINILWWSWI